MNELPKTAEVMEGIVNFKQLRYDPRHHLKDYVVCATRLNEELDEIGADMIPEDELFQKISKEFKLSHYNNESAGGRDDSLSQVAA